MTAPTGDQAGAGAGAVPADGARTGQPGRPAVAFLTWGQVGARAAEIAVSLDGESWGFRPRRLDTRWLAPTRWLLGAVATVWYLLRRRPRAVIATNPPIWLGLITRLYAWLAGAVTVLDSHPGGFGAQGDRVAARLQRLHAWLAARVDLVLVTTPAWVKVVEGWGGRGLVLHEAEPAWSPTPSRPAGEVFHLLFAGVFGLDEPVAEILEAVRELPNVLLSVTGDPRRAPEGLVENAPVNVRFLGYLNQPSYIGALADADAVVVLSTEPTSVMRAACDAVWALRPLLVNDSLALADAFPDAIRADCTPDALRTGIKELMDRHADLRVRADEARARQAGRWREQRDALTAVVYRSGPAGQVDAAASGKILAFGRTRRRAARRAPSGQGPGGHGSDGHRPGRGSAEAVPMADDQSA